MFKLLIVNHSDPFLRSLKQVMVNRFPFVDIKEVGEGLEMVHSFDLKILYIDDQNRQDRRQP